MSASDSQANPREFYEARQKLVLGPWAIGEADSGGRRLPEPPDPYRTCFQRDRDRVVHCSAFRRLDFKTQVFVPHEDDHFRTRLTHTLEVAQIGRDLARALRLNEDLVEVVALAHDLGHPPFGHGGEDVLGELMRDHGGFEHNRQSLRIVDYLEHPYPDFRGLNLTAVVRECLARHETRYDAPVGGQFPAGQPAPLEGQLVDLADEIAYTSADLDDALASGIVEAGQLSGLAIWRRASARAKARWPGAQGVQQRLRATKAVLAEMADDVVATTGQAIRRVGPARPGEARLAGRRLVGFSDEMRLAVNQLQDFLRANVYLAEVTAEQRRRGERIIRELFGAYLNSPSLLPERYGRRIGGRAGDSAHRVVCDYIAGMTDRFCRQEHRKLFGGPA